MRSNTRVVTPSISPGGKVDIFKDTALPLILVFEGSKFTNYPADKGGPTRYGIIQKEYDSYRTEKSLDTQSVENIMMSEVQDIYYTKYWVPSKCDQMSDKLSTVVFDTSVNNGQGRSIKILQQVIGAKVDGIIGQETIQKLSNFDQGQLANKFISSRQDFYKRIVQNDPTQNVFLKGWLRRIQFLSDFVNEIKTLQQIQQEW